MIFLPSLEHIAAVKVALTVYNDDIAHFLGEFIETYKYDPDNSFSISKRQEERIRERKKEIRIKLLTQLPESLVDRVVHILQPIVAEVHFWVRDHYDIIKHIQKRHITNNLCWKSEGTIDRIKTSKLLIQNANVNGELRFALAFAYFYEQDIYSQMFQSLTEKERERIYRNDSDLDVGFWMRWDRERGSSSWTYNAEDFEFDYWEEVITLLNYRCRRVRISSFYSDLNDRYDKRRILHSLWPHLSYVDDLRVCYYLSDKSERDKIFHNPRSPFESKTKDLLCSYIDWPLQTIFLDVVNQMWDRLTPECFEHFLSYIVHQKLSKSMEDFDYLKLFKDLWNRIPDNYKEQFDMETVIFSRALLRYDRKESTLSIAETLEKCRNLIIT
ncbi:uncharacterized protein LOC129981803 [Argiope bruennichi]|uniref:Uncharacterized protein n=1 Tax=Argiope bruennichi TaxID=94029 RepID=A0A8T0G4P7_ARGBR|nr:uncharacterized protein LOC129981803 [Argiope bruennichi]XP_055948794.1 uncharacterized protein LOC129981803 [Argiope bruennichi]XP_055948795.1 uncharacterized protein LOC129981803 [Argiope bruennichi]KAF8797050.1 hypothetical protein HNY73_001361 [Argiope bruennichi]